LCAKALAERLRVGCREHRPAAHSGASEALRPRDSEVGDCGDFGQIADSRRHGPVGAQHVARGAEPGPLEPFEVAGRKGLRVREARRQRDRRRAAPEPVGLYSPNAYGLFNLGDNVHEWCSDWYDAGYYACSPERNPSGPSAGSRRASRGGSWRHHIKVTRTAARSSIPPEFKYADYGFRIARSS